MPEFKIKNLIHTAMSLVGPIIGLAILGLGLYSCATEDSSQGVLAEQTLEGEFRLLKIPDSATTYDYSHSHKANQAGVGAYFHTTMKWPEIRQYYDVELARYGWKFRSDEKQPEIYGDFGGRKGVYCKGPYQAWLEYAGDGARAGWDYGLALSWHLGGGREDCPRF